MQRYKFSGHRFPTYLDTIYNPEMDKGLIEDIDRQGDRQNHQTNVKSQMTNWLMVTPAFNTLKDIVLEKAAKANEECYQRSLNMEMRNIWGMKGKSGEYVWEHDHWPAVWSFVYYIDVPKDAPGIIIENGRIDIQSKMLILFPGYVRHKVEPKEYEGFRYCCSGNIHECINKPHPHDY